MRALVLLLLFLSPISAQTRLLNAATTRQALGLTTAYPSSPTIGDVKIAILDSGFDRFDASKGFLPKSATIVEHYDPAWVQTHNLGDPNYRKPFEPGEVHGRLMAQLVWAATGNSPHGPRFYLLNANGPTLFRRAVTYAIDQHVDIILFSGSFEGAGNFDGRGPINAVVDQAVAAGILWVNAAGNSGGMVFNGPVAVERDGFLRLKSGNDPTALRLVNRLDENTVALTLTWNDYRETEDAGTEKDLDLVLEDAKGNVVAESKLVQVTGREAAAGESKNPRERIVIPDLGIGEYRIRVRAKGGIFGAYDRVRILASGSKTSAYDAVMKKTRPALEMLDATAGREVYPPADHAGVLTVGDGSGVSAKGPTMDGRLKPDVIVSESGARWSNGEDTSGSSNAAAYVAGAVAVLKAAEPRLTMAQVKAWLKPSEPAPRNSIAIQGQTRTVTVSFGRPATSGPPKWTTPNRKALAELVK